MTEGQPFFRLDWVLDNLDQLARRLGEHVLVTVIALTAGFVISFGLALLVRRYPRIYPPILAVSGILYAIPSIALFVLFIPITGLSLLTAEIALVSYTLVILVRNIVTALRGGVRRAHILDGRREHALLLELFTDTGVGTMIHPEVEE